MVVLNHDGECLGSSNILVQVMLGVHGTVKLIDNYFIIHLNK